MQPFGVGKSGFPGLDVLPRGAWDDVRNSATRAKQGQNQKPDFDFTDLGLLFPQNDDGERVYISEQMSHAWEGSDGRRTTLHPHIHYIQDETEAPIFDLQFRFYNNGGAVPAYTTISTADGDGLVFPYSSGTILQIIRFPDIELVGLNSSAWYDMILYRDDNTVGGDVLVKGFDWHAFFNALGSRGEFRK